MLSSRWIAALTGSLLVGSFSGTASAEPPRPEAPPAHHADPALNMPIRPALPPRPVLPTVARPVAHLAPAAIQAPAQPIKPAIVLPTKPQAQAKRAPEATPPSGPVFTLEPRSSDPGIKIRAVTGNRIVVKGVAAGPKVKYLEGLYFENGKRVRAVDYEVSRGISFQVDHDKMPDFSQDEGYTRKNAWYFAHLATTGTEQGDTATAIAQRLAASLNKGGAYRATVEPDDDGAAAIMLEKL